MASEIVFSATERVLEKGALKTVTPLALLEKREKRQTGATQRHGQWTCIISFIEREDQKRSIFVVGSLKNYLKVFFVLLPCCR